MKLWLLKPVEGLGVDSPWYGIYDCANGFVVRAETEDDARSFADSQGGDETRRPFHDTWLQPKYATCEELTGDGEPGVVLCDFNAG